MPLSLVAQAPRAFGFAMLTLAAAHPQPSSDRPQFARERGARTELLAGDGSGLSVRGLDARDSITVRAYRLFVIPRVPGNMVPATGASAATTADTVLFGSWATYRHGRATRGGTRAFVIDSVSPRRGSWHGADARGLFWSMERHTTSRPEGLRPGYVQFVLEHRGVAVDSLTLRTRATLRPIAERVASSSAVTGAYAAPDDGRRHPVVLLLHGSEGGDTVRAKALARRFASRGYAAFALVYVSYGAVHPGVPSTFDRIPVELLDSARVWTGRQPEADTGRTGIWGASKGAELALVAASSRTWPKAVVACVPSDVVWAGFGRAPAAGEELTSWSLDGRAMASVPYDRYEDVFASGTSARVVHDRSRQKFADRIAAARIPIERAAAPLLLLSGTDDEVWNSAAMSSAIVETLRRRGRGRQVSSYAYPAAGHGICGEGTTPWEFSAGDSVVKRATARASADGWRRSLDFLRVRLAAPASPRER